MPLFLSLICLKGRDNGRRFLLIYLVCYFLLIIFHGVLSKAFILLLVLLIVTVPLITASAIRRIHDAGFAAPFAAIPVVVYLFNFFGLSYIEHASRWVLLVLAAPVTLAMATVSHVRVKRELDYKMGYHGPIDLSLAKHATAQTQRIEPTIVGKKNDRKEQADFSETSHATSHATSHTTTHAKQQQKHWEQQLGLWFLQNRRLSIVATLVILAVTFALAFFSRQEKTKQEAGSGIDEATGFFANKTVKARLNKIEMPDQFWLMLDKNDSLTIGWEGDYQKEGDYWSAYTGKGDRDCANLHFNLGVNVKTLLVTVKNGGDYYADFSPVDSEVIIKSIADKDRFKLCGYQFELKGTRSLLRKNKVYFKYLNQS